MNDIHLPESIPVIVVLHHMQNFPQETINNPKDSEFSRLSSTVKNKWPVGHHAPSLSTSVVFVIALSPAGCLSVYFLFMSPDCQPLEGRNQAVDASLSPVEWLKCLAGDGEGIRQYSILLRLHHWHTFWGGAPGCELTYWLGILPTGAAVALFGFFLLLFTLRCCQLILFLLGIHQVTEQLLFCL